MAAFATLDTAPATLLTAAFSSSVISRCTRLQQEACQPASARSRHPSRERRRPTAPPLAVAAVPMPEERSLAVPDARPLPRASCPASRRRYVSVIFLPSHKSIEFVISAINVAGAVVKQDIRQGRSAAEIAAAGRHHQN